MNQVHSAAGPMSRDQLMQLAMDRLASELKACRTLLQSYGDQHSAKFPPQHQKARTNYQQVDSINRVFLHVGELLCEVDNLEQREIAATAQAVADRFPV